MRGKLVAVSSAPINTGITPAGAGKTVTVMCKIIIDKDHPRRCGENSEKTKAKTQYRGSPPQVRGKHPSILIYFSEPRITPAGAGKTVKYPATISNEEDHPRRCGENETNRSFLSVLAGSPPQVRGKLYNSSLQR